VEHSQLSSSESDSGKARRLAPATPSQAWIAWTVDGILLILTIVGVYYAWPVQYEAGRLHAMRVELEQRVGKMQINDPAKYHVMLLKTENPMKFRWRIYIPEKIDTTLTAESRSLGGSSTSTSGFTSKQRAAVEGLVIVTLQMSQDNSSLEIRTSFRVSNTRGLGSMIVQQMVNSRDTSSWRIAGRDGVETISVEDMAWLLVIEPSDPNAAVLRASRLRIGIGTQEAIAKESKP
jgi:hypothetical protein